MALSVSTSGERPGPGKDARAVMLRISRPRRCSLRNCLLLKCPECRRIVRPDSSVAVVQAQVDVHGQDVNEFVQ